MRSRISWRIVVPECRIEYASDAGPDKRCYRVNFEKIASVLPRFQTAMDCPHGRRAGLPAFKSSGLTLEEFEGPRYQRIAHIKKLLADGIIDSDLRHTDKGCSLSRAVLQLRCCRRCAH